MNKMRIGVGEEAAGGGGKQEVERKLRAGKYFPETLK